MRNGDLALGGNQLAQVTGSQKIVQDLRCAFLEHRGHDDMHPTFGSLLDGGLDDQGVEVSSLIGESDWNLIGLRVSSEIRRVIATYQKQQAARAKDDRIRFGQSTLSNSELVASIDDIDLQQTADKLMVTITLTTGASDTFAVTLPLSSTGLVF